MAIVRFVARIRLPTFLMMVPFKIIEEHGYLVVAWAKTSYSLKSSNSFCKFQWLSLLILEFDFMQRFTPLWHFMFFVFPASFELLCVLIFVIFVVSVFLNQVTESVDRLIRFRS